MTLATFWRRRLVTAPARDPIGRLRKVLSKAGVPFQKADPESALAQVEPRQPGVMSLAVTGQDLAFPIAASERIAVLTEGFALPKWARKFDLTEGIQISAYLPQGLVVGLQQARSIAAWSHPFPVEDAMVVHSSLQDHSILTTQDRDRFWKVFGTPLFECLLAWDGTVIARECEVHDGLHVVEGNAILHCYDGELLVTQLNRLDVPVIRARTGIVATLVREHCECGLETPRLRNLASIRPQAAVAA